uniref:(California timema) hypothetical protein n=1 Tax=Timema californicum TaxID=61474 RepID=A0A7R9J2B3_TIMCA|nr:unnamed protein product [Timema californicum]
MKQIAIFGATGQVGLWATRRALALGLSVRVLLREPTRLPEELRSKVDVKQGDATKLEDVQATVEGVDAVLVALGTRNDISASTTMSEGMRNIITAMKSCNVDTVSVCLSVIKIDESDDVEACSGVVVEVDICAAVVQDINRCEGTEVEILGDSKVDCEFDGRKVLGDAGSFLFYDLEKIPPMFRHVTADHQRMLDSIKGSGLKWIAVLPPHFTGESFYMHRHTLDSPSSKYTVKEGSSPGRTITKQDLGQFLVESLSLPQYYNKVLGIATNME